MAPASRDVTVTDTFGEDDYYVFYLKDGTP
jgi:hypothetical protein